MSDNYVTPAAINDMIAKFSLVVPEFVPVLRAVRDFDLCLAMVDQNTKGSFWPMPDGRSRASCLVYLSDGMSKGPRAFHRRSLKRLFRDSWHVVINAADVHILTYSTAGTLALLGAVRPAVCQMSQMAAHNSVPRISMDSPSSYAKGASSTAGGGGMLKFSFGGGGASKAASAKAPVNPGVAALQRGNTQRPSPINSAMVARAAMPQIQDDGPGMTPDRD